MNALNRTLRAIYSALVSLYRKKIIRFNTIFANFASWVESEKQVRLKREAA